MNTKKQSLALYAAIFSVIIILINLIAFNRPLRIDLTDNQVFTLSNSTKSVISSIEDAVVITVYFSENLPGTLSNTSRFVQDILEEYRAHSNGMIRFEFKNPDDDEEAQKYAQMQGIQPVQVNVWENDRRETRLIYLAISISYEGNSELLPLVQNTTGFEYDLTKKIKKLINTEMKSIGIAQFDMSGYQNEGIKQLISESYNIVDIDMTSQVPENIDLLLINGISDSINVTQIEHLANFINSGNNILWTQGRVDVALNQQIGFFEGQSISSNIFDFINIYGVNIEDNLLLDKVNGQINIPQRVSIFQTWASMDYPFFPTISRFNNEHNIVSGLEKMQFHYCSEITIDSSASNVTPLLYTSRNTGTMSGFYNLTPNTDNSPNPILNNLNEGQKIIGVLIDTGSGGDIILLPESGMFADPIDQQLQKVFAQREQDNYTFFENAVDYLMGDEGLVELRSREVLDRPLISDLDDATKSWWKWFNIIIPPLLIVAMGFIISRKRKNRSDELKRFYG